MQYLLDIKWQHEDHHVYTNIIKKEGQGESREGIIIEYGKI